MTSSGMRGVRLHRSPLIAATVRYDMKHEVVLNSLVSSTEVASASEQRPPGWQVIRSQRPRVGATSWTPPILIVQRTKQCPVRAE